MRPIRSAALRATFAIVLTFAALTLASLPAWGAGALTVSGSAPATAHGPGTVPFTFTINAASDLDSLSVTTMQDAFLPADPSSVALDGIPVAAAQVSHSGGNITATLGAVAAAVHHLTYEAFIQATPSTITSTGLSAQYTQGGGEPVTVEAAAITVDINEPDIAVELELPEGDAATPPATNDILLGTGQGTAEFFRVSNNGYGEPPVTVSIELPPGLIVGADQGAQTNTGPLNCTTPSPSRLLCPLGRITHSSPVELGIFYEASAAAIPGTTASISVTARADEGTEQAPDDNTANGSRVHFTGTAHLVLTMRPDATKITVGKTTRVTVTLKNEGPQRVDLAGVFLFIDRSDVLIVAGFDGNTTPPDLGSFFASTATRLSADAQGPGDPEPDFVQWFITGLEPGTSVSAHLTLKAVHVGAARLGSKVFETAGDPACKDPSTVGCNVSLAFTAVSPPPARRTATRTPTPTPTPTAHSASVATIANSGSAPWPLTALGFWFLGVGSLLTRLGRTPRSDLAIVKNSARSVQRANTGTDM
jgi:hypothetical protein